MSETNYTPPDPAVDAQLSAWRAANDVPRPRPAWLGLAKILIASCLLVFLGYLICVMLVVFPAVVVAGALSPRFFLLIFGVPLAIIFIVLRGKSKPGPTTTLPLHSPPLGMGSIARLWRTGAYPNKKGPI